MIIVMKNGATQEHITRLSGWLTDRFGVHVNPIYGTGTTVLALVGDTASVDKDALLRDEYVERITKVQEPFKLANRKMHPQDTTVEIGNGVLVGGKKLVVMAGPCSVESQEQIIDVARHVKAQGAAVLRGGAWKPRSSPYSFQGLKAEGLELLHKAHEATGLPVVTEIMSEKHLDLFADVDIIQLGARNMQNFMLLKELGRSNKPILLKRGLSATMEEFLMAAEYIFAGGNKQVMLCERGIRTFETMIRNNLDISAIPLVKNLTHLPIIIDPSHAAGKRELVAPLSRAAIAAGADGLMIEAHNNPKCALCDGAQSLDLPMFDGVMTDVKRRVQFEGRELQ